MISGINATTSNLPIFFISFESIINLSYVKYLNSNTTFLTLVSSTIVTNEDREEGGIGYPSVHSGQWPHSIQRDN